jgi:3-deoxy-D-manno-octulosonic-acid transferase
MARSLGLAAYRALSRRKSRPLAAFSRPRPEGELLWLHATSPDRLLTLGELGVRVQSQRDALEVLITVEQDEADPRAAMPELEARELQVDQLASDHPSEARDFLDHWRPDICLWGGASLMPNLIGESADRGIPMILIDVNRSDFSTRKHKWFPDLTRSSLGLFDAIMVNNQAASNALRRMGVSGRVISITEPLRNGPSPLPFAEEDLSSTSQQLSGRPLWLAAHAQTDEFDQILAAHRIAQKLVHRLLLVLTVSDPELLSQLEAHLQGTGMRFARWVMGEDIDENTQVLISDGVDDLGLWFRMAPLTFMASSLTIGSTGRNPLEAVALGSAILFGPHVQGHRDTYSRLAAVGAARSIGDADGLGVAVIRLVAPDHAAAMALAGWQVVTEGAALSDRLVELVQDRLDMKGTHHARP